MAWWQYPMVFFGGAFVANFIPHFVRGATGTQFPTPFAKPPGHGPSPPTVNVAWGLFNLLVGYLLLWGGGFSIADRLPAGVAFTGFAVMGLMLSKAFATFPS